MRILLRRHLFLTYLVICREDRCCLSSYKGFRLRSTWTHLSFHLRGDMPVLLQLIMIGQERLVDRKCGCIHRKFERSLRHRAAFHVKNSGDTRSYLWIRRGVR